MKVLCVVVDKWMFHKYELFLLLLCEITKNVLKPQNEIQLILLYKGFCKCSTESFSFPPPLLPPHLQKAEF